MKNKGKEHKEQKKYNFNLVHTEMLFEVLMSFGALELPDSDSKPFPGAENNYRYCQCHRRMPFKGGWVTAQAIVEHCLILFNIRLLIKNSTGYKKRSIAES